MRSVAGAVSRSIPCPRSTSTLAQPARTATPAQRRALSMLVDAGLDVGVGMRRSRPHARRSGSSGGARGLDAAPRVYGQRTLMKPGRAVLSPSLARNGLSSPAYERLDTTAYLRERDRAIKKRVAALRAASASPIAAREARAAPAPNSCPCALRTRGDARDQHTIPRKAEIIRGSWRPLVTIVTPRSTGSRVIERQSSVENAAIITAWAAAHSSTAARCARRGAEPQARTGGRARHGERYYSLRLAAVSAAISCSSPAASCPSAITRADRRPWPRARRYLRRGSVIVAPASC